MPDTTPAAGGVAKEVLPNDTFPHQRAPSFRSSGDGLNPRKTTFLANQATKWARERGSEELVVASFTKAAAAEIAGRDMPLKREQVSTLHSLAFRALDLHKDLTAEEHANEFNEQHPGWELTKGRASPEDVAFGIGRTAGDKEHELSQVLRAQQVPFESWPSTVQSFYMVWRGWCAENGYVDFTGMIEGALADVERAPGNPSIGLFDEAQDFTPLELALVRKWGEHMDLVLLAGDDDQAIYGFKGASPDVFLDPPIPDERKRVLSRSYRVPRAVHSLASAWIEQVKRREPKSYEPRLDGNGDVAEGSVVLGRAGMDDPLLLAEQIWRDVEGGWDVMVLATCGYMLRPLITELRNKAIPFHNPYRVQAGEWNPLRSGGATRQPVDRLLAYLRPDPTVWGHDARWWHFREAWDWIELMRARGLLRSGAKTWLKAQVPTAHASPALLAEHVWADADGDEATQLEASDIEAFNKYMLQTHHHKYVFPLAIARKRGAALLRQRPHVVLGTIHSVKGAEADVVYLMPDLSAQGYDQWVGPTKDEVIRQIYVGMTRAREKLVVCEGGKRSVPLQSFVRQHQAMEAKR